jgi:hypothetical protein
VQAKERRGEDFEFEFAIEFGAFTAAEQDDYVALMEERIAHGEERLEALQEDNRVLLALLDLVESSDAPPGTTLWEAGQAGYIGVMQVVETIRGAVPDPLAKPN